nr:zinc metalloproteinase dpy-31-like isoform X2 [Crassostrea gigas]
MKTVLVFCISCLVSDFFSVCSSHESGRQEKSRLLSRLLGLIREYEDKRTIEDAGSQSVSQGSGNFQLPDGFTWEEWELMEKDGQGHGQDIDSWDGNQDSAVGVLVDSFVVYDKNGTGHRPKGYEPWNHAAAKANNFDHHKPPPPTKRNYEIGITLWHNTIPYEIAPNLGDEMISIIKESMKQLQELTCLKFIPAGLDDADLMYFANVGDGCYSYVGRQGGKQVVNLDPNQCATVSTALHEIMHALGMWHEQQRVDRDNYIKILKENIENPEDNMVNYEKHNTANELPYDVESVLQYDLRALTKNNLPTMELFDTSLEFLINSAQTMTFYDVAEITKNQQCTDHCPAVGCENGGFQTFKCNCMCPSGLSGPSCENLDSSNGCGEIITLNAGEQREITSPSWPNMYNLDMECVWLIKSKKPNTVLRFKVENLKLSRSNTDDRCYHWLEIRYNLIGQTGPRLCGEVGYEEYLTPSSDSISKAMLKFNSRFSKDKPASLGFKIRVEALKAGQDLCTPNPCHNSGLCVNTGHAFLCKCPNEYTGAVCDIKIRPCEKAPCRNNGDCTNVGESAYTCQCKPGFHGTNCDSKTTETCEPNPCHNGGSCFIEGTDAFECFCDFDFTGRRCENKLQSFCDSSPCFNGGQCIPGTEVCYCTDNWTGKLCDTPKGELGLLDKNNCTFNKNSECVFQRSQGQVHDHRPWDFIENSYLTTDSDGFIFLQQNKLQLEDGQEYCLSLDVYSDSDSNTLYAFLPSNSAGDIIDLYGSTGGNMIRRMGSFFGLKSTRIVVSGSVQQPEMQVLAVDNIALRRGSCQ